MPPASSAKLAEIRVKAAETLKMLATLTNEEKVAWRAKRKEEKARQARERYYERKKAAAAAKEKEQEAV